jgi:hypothetical protein
LELEWGAERFLLFFTETGDIAPRLADRAIRNCIHLPHHLFAPMISPRSGSLSLAMNPGIAKVLPLLLATAVCGGCASSGPPLPPSLELPAPVSDLHAVRKGNHVSLTWTLPTQTTDHVAIRHLGPTRVCRGAGTTLADCGQPAGGLPAVPQGGRGSPGQKAAEPSIRYTDELPATPVLQPDDEVTYAVEVLNTENRSAGLSNRARVPAFPATPPPEDFAAKLTAEGVSLSWRCPAALPELANVQYRLRVVRTPAGGEGSTAVADSDLMNCTAAPVIDSSLEWEKTYQYRAFVATVVSLSGKPEIEIDGDDTPSVEIIAHDVFPPALPSGLQAVFSGVGQASFIDLVWMPDTDADLAGYNIYRHEEGAEPVKLNTELAKTPAYRDKAVEAGKKYFYTVSAVDVRGNESARSEEASEKVP